MVHVGHRDVEDLVLAANILRFYIILLVYNMYMNVKPSETVASAAKSQVFVWWSLKLITQPCSLLCSPYNILHNMHVVC